MRSVAKRALLDPIVDDNPVTLHVLGICSALAVTTSLLPSIDDVPGADGRYWCLSNASVSAIRTSCRRTFASSFR